MASGNTAQREQLENAFQVFNQVSEQLVDSYQQLQMKVAHLSAELLEARSERMRQVEEKERLANRISRLLEILPAAVIVLDGEGRVSQFNTAARQLIPGLDLDQPWQTLYNSHFRPGQQGDEQWLSSGRLVSYSERSLGTEPGRILLLLDVTETRELQQRIERQNRLGTMGEMAARLAHQVRTPISSTLIYTAHLARDDLSSAQRQRFSSQCTQRLQHMERQINDMLAFARGGQFEPEQIPVAGLLKELKLSIEPALKRQDADLELLDRSGDALLTGNPAALLGAFSNLLVNALDHGEAGLRLQIQAERRGERLHIHFRDNGPGIPADIQARVFDPFFTTRSDGTGLGLAVVQSVVLAHRGEISVKSRTGEGSCFLINLPLSGQGSARDESSVLEISE